MEGQQEPGVWAPRPFSTSSYSYLITGASSDGLLLQGLEDSQPWGCRKECLWLQFPQLEEEGPGIELSTTQTQSQKEPVVSKATELTCLSAISGFPPPFCELGIKSPGSALAPHFPSSILSSSLSTSSGWISAPTWTTLSLFLSTPQDKDRVARVSNAIHQVFPVPCPLTADCEDCVSLV